MNNRYSSWAFVVLFIFLLGTSVEAGTTPRDFSGDAMQRHNSQMMVSPMIRFPAVLGISPWPYINYPPAPSMTIVNVQVDIPHGEEPPVSTTSKPPARPKFWIARCGGFIEIEAAATMSVIDEERKPCSLTRERE
jgi:hypothetical protein